MTPRSQIVVGSLALSLCVVLHVAALGFGIELLQSMEPGDGTSGMLRRIGIVLAGTGVALVGHTMQVWVWVAMLRSLGALEGTSDALYFVLVTTTTLGYGDVTLDRGHRILGAMAAVTGLMTFGLSAAFLIGIVSQLYAINP